MLDDLKTQKKKMGEIRDRDSREAYLYHSIRNEAIDMLIDAPDAKIRAITVNQ